MRNGIVILLMVVLVCAASLFVGGCAEVKYGGAKMVRLGDSNTEDLYAERCTGPMTITVDANTGQLNYFLEDTNSTFTQFSFGSSVSEGRLPALEVLVPAIVEAVRMALAPVPDD